MTAYDLTEILRNLLSLPAESELVEFKEAKTTFDSDKLGEYFSALSNEANLKSAQEAWLVFGVNNPQEVVGTAFRADPVKLQSLTKEIADHCTNRLTFRGIHELTHEGKRVILFEIPPATAGYPTAWKGHHYGRDGESLGPLNTDERHRIEGRFQQQLGFERGIAYANASISHILELLDWQKYFALCEFPEPTDAQEIVVRLASIKAVVRADGQLHITNLGAVLFARDLRLFEHLAYKSIRIILYEGTGQTGAKMEQTGQLGYAIGFNRAANWLNDRLPSQEEIGRALRTTVPTYPIKAVRELMANALIHQDFTVSGSTLMVEVFINRIEITNPGTPLINVLEFLNHIPVSRNEAIAATMQSFNFCERQGSGIDRVVEECEKHQLPAPDFIRGDNYTQAILYAPRPLREMDRRHKIRACYQHACLKHANGQQMTNQSFRERMGIAEKNYSIASRIIAETIEEGLIRPYDPENKSKKHAKYIPVFH
ncbi:ATP-binding protein [Hymenobacter artigasi]|uniref:HTH transcriptional regulator n=1 Tax=Hymenobacter artigasi TaxID=2719616 RepID=A0ABX1HPH9_9BACT|nr:ATP-binding protein [Hymenobacter artigasi]NKI90831.1 putative HTH transcriptional regulator [Hymenobacter artigasi]